MGVVLGGRIGYCLFYNPSYYVIHPLEVLYGLARWHEFSWRHDWVWLWLTWVFAWQRQRKKSLAVQVD